MDVNVQAGTTLWAIGFSGGLLPSGIPVPGFGGLLCIDITLLENILAGVGNTTFPIALPPGLEGVESFIQGALYNGVGFDFRNVSGIRIW